MVVCLGIKNGRMGDEGWVLHVFWVITPARPAPAPPCARSALRPLRPAPAAARRPPPK